MANELQLMIWQSAIAEIEPVVVTIIPLPQIRLQNGRVFRFETKNYRPPPMLYTLLHACTASRAEVLKKYVPMFGHPGFLKAPVFFNPYKDWLALKSVFDIRDFDTHLSGKEFAKDLSYVTKVDLQDYAFLSPKRPIEKKHIDKLLRVLAVFKNMRTMRIPKGTEAFLKELPELNSRAVSELRHLGVEVVIKD